MRDKVKLLICAMVCITLIICGILFWPTLYRYDKTTSQKIVRINRITGYTEILYPSRGWEPLREVVIPSEEMAKITSKNGYFDGEGNYKFVVYNGTVWTIKKIRLSIGLKDALGKEVQPKIYETYAYIDPFSAGSCSLKLIDDVPKPSGSVQMGQSGGKAYTYTDEQLKEIAGGKTIILPEVKLVGAFGYKGE